MRLFVRYVCLGVERLHGDCAMNEQNGAFLNQ